MRDLLLAGEESEVLADLSTFRCARDPDIENFLMEDAIPFEKAHKARTYLMIELDSMEKREMAIVAYFTIALKCFQIGDGVSASMKRKLNGIFQNDIIPCYLLGQLGKNDRYADQLRGREVIELAMDLIMDAHERVGGRFISVDCRDSDGLLRFYRDSGFTLLPSKNLHGLHQLVRFI